MDNEIALNVKRNASKSDRIMHILRIMTSRNYDLFNEGMIIALQDLAI
jgi:hypothetical protein